MTIDIQKKYEKDVEALIDQMSSGHNLIMYKLLYAEGCRMSTVDEEIRKIKEYVPLVKSPEDIDPAQYHFMV